MTNARRPEVATRLSLVAILTLTAMFSVGLLPAHAQVSSLPIQFSDVVIFGTNSVRLGSNAQVVAGHVVVNNSSPGPTLTSGFELGIASNVHTPAGYAIVGDSIQVLSNAVIGGNAFFNNLSNAGTIQGSQNTPLPPFPIFAPLPTFQPSTSGTLDVNVPANQTQTLAPGNYRDIHVLSNGTLRLSAGVYNVRSILTDSNAKILFQNLASGKADVRVQNQLTTGSNGIVRSDDGDPLKAAKIIFYVGFASGAGLTPNAVTFGSNGTIHANVYAPNGTVRLDSNVNATGAFLGRDVDLGSNVHVDLETFFSQQAPAITSANATTFTVGQAGTFTVTATGFPTPSIVRGGAALPSGVTFTDNGNGTGTLSGTPAAGTGGTYAITFTASNGVPPNAVQNFTLTVNQAPAITSANTTTFTVGTAGSFTVTTSGFPAPSIARGGAALPAGVSFIDNGNGTGTLSGTPAAGTGGNYAITFTATNTAGSSPTQSFTLVVRQAPVITSANSTTFIVGQAGSFTVTTTGFPAASITQGGALPAGVSFTNNGNGTATLSGTPAAGSAGNSALTFTATNSAGSQNQNFTLTVAQAPTITNANATTFTVGQFGTFTVTTTGFPPASIAQGGTLPAGVTFISNGDGTGTLSGTPAAGTGGVYAITFTATNVAGSSPTQNFTLTVNQAPAITSANTTTFTVGQPGTFTVTTTGFPTPSIAQGGALPAGVTFTNNGNGTGTLSGTPAAGSGGVYPLTFTASNGVPPNAVQSFTLGVNAPPSAVNDGPYLTDANTTFSRVTSDPDDLLDNDSLGFPVATLTSFGGGSLGGSVTSNAAGATATFGTGGSLTVQSNGAFTFTPETGFTGAFTFQYRLTNAGGTSDATVTIHVRPKATLDIFLETVVGNVVVNTGTGTLFSVLTNDVFNGTVIFGTSGLSTNGGTVSLNPNGTFVYNPPVGFQGSDNFTYTITDSSGFTSAPAAVSVTVSGIIWFVNDNSGACSSLCNGRLTNPFTTLQAFTSVNDGVGTHPANSQNIFVYESATPYTFSTGTLLRAGQKLIGQDATATLATIAAVTVPSGSSLPAMNTGGNATTLGSTVTLAGSSTVRGLTISTGTFTGLSGGAVSGVAVSEVIVVTTTGTAVNLSGTGGTVSLASVSASGAANGIVLANTSGSFTVTGDGTTTSGLLNRNGSGGTITGTVGHAVSLTNASDVTLRQMNITNTAVGGACPLACASNAVNSTGGGNIVLSAVSMQNLGGHGWSATDIAGTNGFDQNSKVDTWNTPNTNGVVVTNTNTNFTSFTVDHALVTTSATGAAGFNVNANGATSGTVNVTNSEFTLIDQNAAQILNNGSGTLTAIVQKSNFHDADATGGDGNNTLLLSLAGSGQLNFTIGGPNVSDGNTFRNLARLAALAGVVQVNAVTTSVSGSRLNGSIQHNSISNAAGFVNGRRAIDIGIEANNGAHGGHAILIADNTVTNVFKQGINVVMTTVAGGDTQNNDITIRGNVLTNVGTEGNVDSGSAIEVEDNVDAANVGSNISANILVQGNSASNNNTSAVGTTLEINNRAMGGNNTSVFNVTVWGNSLTNAATAGNAEVFELLNSIGDGTANPTTCLDLNAANNPANANTYTGGNGTGFKLTGSAGTFGIAGMAAGAQPSTAVEAFLEPHNNGLNVTAAGSFAGTGSCTLPSPPTF